jgi:hypothetical protein
MLSEPDRQTPDENAAPEILIIKDIILRDLRRAHEARMEAIETHLARLEKECAANFAAVHQRIDSLAAVSEQSQKQALAELGESISEIANRFRLGQGTARDVG